VKLRGNAAADASAQFHAQGYLHARGILSPGLVRMLDTLMREQLALQADRFHATSGIDLMQPAQLQRWLDAQTDPDAWFLGLPRATQHLVRGEYPLEVRMRPEFLQLADETKLVALLQTLLGSPSLRLNHPTMLRFKVPGMEQAKVPLHQDGPYFPHISNFATVWIPLCAITEECGGINVLEGSHRRGLVRHEEAVLWGNYIPHEEAAGFTDRHILMAPGDALIFGPHLQHYTHANRSDQVRYSIDSRWFGDDTATSRQYFDLRTRQVVQMF
jgi:hypothetical protein